MGKVSDVYLDTIAKGFQKLASFHKLCATYVASYIDTTSTLNRLGKSGQKLYEEAVAKLMSGTGTEKEVEKARAAIGNDSKDSERERDKLNKIHTQIEKIVKDYDKTAKEVDNALGQCQQFIKTKKSPFKKIKLKATFGKFITTAKKVNAQCTLETPKVLESARKAGEEIVRNYMLMSQEFNKTSSKKALVPAAAKKLAAAAKKDLQKLKSNLGSVLKSSQSLKSEVKDHSKTLESMAKEALKFKAEMKDEE